MVQQKTSDLLPISQIAAKLHLSEHDLEPYGRYTAKVKLPASIVAQPGKLILVTAITPTSHGEGKTVVSIGIAQAIAKLGKSSVVTLREPSLGPLFGVKGGATGGGRSRVLPSEKINLHFNGDKHAVAAAHNLLAAMVDSHLYHGNELRIEANNVSWPRTLDMNDRALRRITIGMGGRSGAPRDSRFVITAASEVMAVLALADSRADCARRLSEITIGLNLDGRPLRAKDLEATGAMMVLLNEAVLPNLVQTSEHTPALIHTGPFANIAHGTSSVLAQRIGLACADYVINETGFGADLGAEKFLDIVMPSSGLKPSAAVLVATVRGLRHHSQSSQGIEHGLENLAKHIENLAKFHLPTVVALNRFSSDTDQDLRAAMDFCRGLGVESAIVDVFNSGGEGAVELAGQIIEAAEKADLNAIQPLYSPNLSFEDKITVIAKDIYGARGVQIKAAAKQKLELLSGLGFTGLPVCMAKTQYSLSDDPKKLGAPKNWSLTISDAHLASGAGFVVVVAGDMTLMPGLPKVPQATRMRVNEDGSISGLC